MSFDWNGNGDLGGEGDTQEATVGGTSDYTQTGEVVEGFN